MEVVVDGVASATALAEDLAVFESGDDVLDACPDPTVRPVVVVVDDPASVVRSRGGDRADAAVSAVTEDDMTVEEVSHGMAGHDDVVAVTGPAWADGNHSARVSADDDLGVDTAAVVLADGGDRLIVHRDQGGVDDPRVLAVRLVRVAANRPGSAPGDELPDRQWLDWFRTVRPAPGWSGWCAGGSALAVPWRPSAGSRAAPG